MVPLSGTISFTVHQWSLNNNSMHAISHFHYFKNPSISAPWFWASFHFSIPFLLWNAALTVTQAPMRQESIKRFATNIPATYYGQVVQNHSVRNLGLGLWELILGCCHWLAYVSLGKLLPLSAHQFILNWDSRSRWTLKSLGSLNKLGFKGAIEKWNPHTSEQLLWLQYKVPRTCLH